MNRIPNSRATSKHLFVFQLFLVLQLAGTESVCHRQTDPDPLAPDKFVRVYSEMLFLSLDTLQADSSQDFQALLDSLRISRDDFERSIAAYEEEPERWLEILTKTTEQLKKKQSAQDSLAAEK
ncbi:MAG: hypothetical protein ACE5IY_00790 [bacterium]